ncbi:MAG: SpoIIE family protein phosphatase [candidate division Zixibacteria bacterium]|nr:SpoIIE family protein phosphatase [candidate division Zixibacteria bacterium]
MTDSIQHTRTEKLLLEAARTFNTTLEYEELITRVLRLVMTAVGAEAALVFRVDHDRTDMKIRLLKRGQDKLCVFRQELGSGVVGWVANFRKPMLINDATSDTRVDPEIETRGEIKINSLVSVPLIGKGQMIGVIEAINKSEGEFTAVDQDILIGLTNQIAVAIDNAHLYREMKREAFEKNLLFEIGIKLSHSLNLDEVLQEIIRSLNKAVDFDAGGVFLVDPERGEIGSIMTEGYQPGKDSELALKIGQGVIGQVVTTGEPVIVGDVSKDERYIPARARTNSEIVVPMVLGTNGPDGKVIGVLNLESDKLRAFNRRQLALIQVFASQAAISVERARLHEEILSGKKIEEQLNVAREIQRTFLPRANPNLPGYDIDGINISSGQVGGDYYDFITILDTQTGIAIGDVSGKGVPASLIMASFRASLIAEIRNNYAIRAIAHKVNNLLYESITSGNFVTAIYSVLDSRNHILTFCNCGHDLPILLRADGKVEFLREGGPVLGVSQDAKYEERPVFLNPGEIVVFYTDGVTEVFDRSGEQFGLDRLIELIKANRNKPAEEIQTITYKAVKAFAAPDHIFDDFTMVVLKRNE